MVSPHGMCQETPTPAVEQNYDTTAGDDPVHAANEDGSRGHDADSRPAATEDTTRGGGQKSPSAPLGSSSFLPQIRPKASTSVACAE